jgi:hypothetical protein
MRIDVEATFASACALHRVEPFEVEAFDLRGLNILADDACAMARDDRDVQRAFNWITNQVSIRVLLEKRLRDEPALRDVPVTAPVFIIGSGRTGSTLLQWLLALEPSLRSPHLWELMSPMYANNPASRRWHIEACEKVLKRVPAAAMELHPLAAQAPDECHWILRHNPVRAGMHRAPRYGEWLYSLELTALRAVFEGYRRQVQVLQAADPGRHWLSKTFAHMHYWPVLFDVFPDARVIRLHRDPRQSIASNCSLQRHLSQGIDPLVIGDDLLAATRDGQYRMMFADDRAPPGQVIDVMYEDLRAAPAKVARDLAAWLKIPDEAVFGHRVDRYLADAASIRAAPHSPSLDDFGLTEHDVLDRLEPYIAWVRARLDPGFCR